ncbi:MAG TPA: hypothetical protein EYP49_16055 [Anaerolineae bacterium]|nr:hypothetical protein [Anaerolineae bacterium]
MADKELIEILAAHADKLNVGASEETERLAMLPEYQDTLRPLLTVARKVKDALAPVELDPAFCENLRLSLLAAAHQRLASRLSSKPRRPVHLFKRHKKEILIGAAALGSVVSVAGIVAYWIHSRAAKAQRVLSG